MIEEEKHQEISANTVEAAVVEEEDEDEDEDDEEDDDDYEDEEDDEDEEEEEEEGPPPGFQRIITPHPPPAEESNNEEEDGPPPGFDCIAPKPLSSLPSSDTASSKQDDMDDDEDGPPPGWEFGKLVNALPKETSGTTDMKEECNEELDEGPPPGWESVLPCQMPQPHTPPQQPPSTVSPNSEMGSKQITPKNDNEVDRLESEHTPMLGQLSPATPPPQQLPSSEQPSAMADSVHATYLDAWNKEEDKRNDEKRPTSGHQSVSPLQQLPSNSHPLTPVPKSSSSEKAQLVCGTCRKLCLYTRGAKWIRCPGCQEVNFVLEADEVGQVTCGGCAVLLMYPHGAPAVQCSCCLFVTEIGAHNRRPPLSVQHAQARDQRKQRRCNRAR